MSVRKRGNRYVIDYYPNGRHGKRERLTLPDDVQDEDTAKRYEADFKRAAHGVDFYKPVSADIRVCDLFTEYLDWYELNRLPRSHKDITNVYNNHIKRILGEYKLVDFNEDHITLYKRLRRGESVRKANPNKKKNNKFTVKSMSYKISARTINKELAYLSGFLKWCRRNKEMNVHKLVVDKLPYKRPIPMILSFDEVIKIIQAAEPFYRALFLCLYCVGLRYEEASTLTLDEVDFDNHILKVKQKGGSEKIVPANEWLIKSLEEIKPKKGKYFFYNPRTKEPLKDPRRAIARAVKKAGVIKKVTPHLFRHSIATHLLGKNVNLRTIQKLLGHKQITTTEFYTHVDIEDLKKASDFMFNGLPKNIGDYGKPQENQEVENSVTTPEMPITI